MSAQRKPSWGIAEKKLAKRFLAAVSADETPRQPSRPVSARHSSSSPAKPPVLPSIPSHLYSVAEMKTPEGRDARRKIRQHRLIQEAAGGSKRTTKPAKRPPVKTTPVAPQAFPTATSGYIPFEDAVLGLPPVARQPTLPAQSTPFNTTTAQPTSDFQSPQRKAAEMQVNSLHTRLTRVKEQLAVAQDENRKLKAQVQEKQAKSAAHSETLVMLRSLRTQIETHKKELGKAQAASKSAELKHSELIAQREELEAVVDGLKQEIAAAQRQTAAAEASAREAENHVVTAHQERDSAQAEMRVRERAWHEARLHLQSELSARDDQLASVRRSLQETEAADRRAREDAASRLTTLLAELNSVKERVIELQETVTRRGNEVSRVNEQLSARKAQFKKDRASLLSRIADADEGREKAEAKALDVQKQMESLQVTHKSTKASLEQQQDLVAKNRRELEVSQAALIAARNSLLAAEEARERTAREHQQAIGSVTRDYETQLSKLQTSLNRARNDVLHGKDTLRKQKEIFEGEKTNLKEMLSGLQDRLSHRTREWNEEKAKLETAVQRAQHSKDNELMAVRGEAKSLQAQLQLNKQHHVDAVDSLREKHEKRVADLQAASEKLRKKLEHTEGALAAKTAKVEALKISLGNHKEDHANALRKVSDELHERERVHKLELSECERELKETTANLEHQWSRKVTGLRADHDKKMQSLRNEWQEKYRQAVSDGTAKVQNLSTSHAKKLAQLMEARRRVHREVQDAHETQVSKMREDHADEMERLKSAATETLETTTEELERKLRVQEREWTDRLAQTQKMQTQALADCKAELSRDLVAIRQERDRAKEQNVALESQVFNLHREIDRTARLHAAAIGALKDQNGALAREKAVAEELREAEVRRAQEMVATAAEERNGIAEMFNKEKQEMDVYRNKLAAEWEGQKARLVEGHQNEVSNLRKRQDANVVKLKENFSAELKRLSDQHVEQLQHQKAVLRQARESFKTQEQEALEVHAASLSRLQEQHGMQMADITRQHHVSLENINTAHAHELETVKARSGQQIVALSAQLHVQKKQMLQLVEENEKLTAWGEGLNDERESVVALRQKAVYLKQEACERLRLIQREQTALKQLMVKFKEQVAQSVLQCRVDMNRDTDALQQVMMKTINSEKVLRQKYVYEKALRCKYFEIIQKLRGNIRVFCRLRPRNETERELSEPIACQAVADDDKSIFLYLRTTEKWRRFRSDHVFAAQATNKQVFSQFEPLVQSLWDGYNVCLMAYGPTGTGKSYTIFGDLQQSEAQERAQASIGESQPALLSSDGLIYHSAAHLFGIQQQNVGVCEAHVYMSMTEIYNEEISDLLLPRTVANIPELGEKALAIWRPTPQGTQAGSYDRLVGSLKLRERTGDGHVYVEGLSEWEVKNPSQVLACLREGLAQRQTADTLSNQNSSRSHCVVTLRTRIQDQSTGEIKQGSMHFVDLAGSERLKIAHSYDKSSGKLGSLSFTADSRAGKLHSVARENEAKHINKSLAALGNVLEALQKKRSHVPYRDSKLTYLLKDAIGGKAKCVMIVNVAPCVGYMRAQMEDTEHKRSDISAAQRREGMFFEQTYQSLVFAQRVRQVALGPASRNVHFSRKQSSRKMLTHKASRYQGKEARRDIIGARSLPPTPRTPNNHNAGSSRSVRVISTPTQEALVHNSTYNRSLPRSVHHGAESTALMRVEPLPTPSPMRINVPQTPLTYDVDHPSQDPPIPGADADVSVFQELMPTLPFGTPDHKVSVKDSPLRPAPQSVDVFLGGVAATVSSPNDKAVTAPGFEKFLAIQDADPGDVKTGPPATARVKFPTPGPRRARKFGAGSRKKQPRARSSSSKKTPGSARKRTTSHRVKTPSRPSSSIKSRNRTPSRPSSSIKSRQRTPAKRKTGSTKKRAARSSVGRSVQRAAIRQQNAYDQRVQQRLAAYDRVLHTELAKKDDIQLPATMINVPTLSPSTVDSPRLGMMADETSTIAETSLSAALTPGSSVSVASSQQQQDRGNEEAGDHDEPEQGMTSGHSSPDPQPAPLPHPHPQAMSPSVNVETHTQIKAPNQTDGELVTPSETQQQAGPQSQPQPDPQTQPQADPQTQPQAEPQTQQQAEPQTQPQPEPQTQPQAEPQTQPQAAGQAQSEAQTGSQAENDSGPSASDGVAHPVSETGVSSVSATQTVADETVTDETVTDTQTATDTQPNDSHQDSQDLTVPAAASVPAVIKTTADDDQKMEQTVSKEAFHSSPLYTVEARETASPVSIAGYLSPTPPQQDSTESQEQPVETTQSLSDDEDDGYVIGFFDE